MPLGEHVVEDYASLGLSLKRHPLAFLRAELAREGLVTAADLARLPVDRRLAIAGIVLIRQRPGSANGVVFITIEDETGIANLIVWPADPRTLPPRGAGRHLAALHRQVAARAKRHPCRRRASRRPDPAAQHLARPHRRGRDGPPAKPPAVPVKAPGYDIRDIVVRSRNFR